MPANSLLGQRAVLVNVSAAAAYAYSLADTYAMLDTIPTPGGTTLTFPANPSDGDVYEWGDADGSCSQANPIVVQPGATPAGTTVSGAANVTFTKPRAAGSAVYREKNNNWVVMAAVPGGGTTTTQSVQGIGAGGALGGAFAALATTPALPVPGPASFVNVFGEAEFDESAGAAATVQFELWMDGAIIAADVLCSQTLAANAHANVARTFRVTGIAAGNHTFAIAAKATVGAATVPAGTAVARAVIEPS